MWKKSEPEESSPQPSPETRAANTSIPKAPAPRNREHATIGSTISIKGDLSGEEDLLIEGKLEGKIECHNHSVTVGKNGRIKGDIYGKIITVEGNVEGNLYGDEQLSVLQAGTVRGNIIAPRVALEDGANFKGSIDMSQKGKSPAVTTQDQISMATKTT
ncbi:MAG: polymer-forming cytoskeletal protein [Acidobacteria bacterium]|nr:polymer-forming cytoskeletal protein [Acidobacteriota bacterium]